MRRNFAASALFLLLVAVPSWAEWFSTGPEGASGLDLGGSSSALFMVADHVGLLRTDDLGASWDLVLEDFRLSEVASPCFR